VAYIFDFTLYHPETLITDSEISNLTGMSTESIFSNFGFKKKHIGKKNELPSDMAIQACLTLFKKIKLNKNEVDCIIYASSGVSDYQFWSASGKIHHTMQITNGFGFDIHNGCSSISAALLLANSLIDQKICKKILITAAEANSIFVDYRKPSLSPFYSLADGAAAILVTEDIGKFKIIDQMNYTDGKYNNVCKIEYGSLLSYKHSLPKSDPLINFDINDTLVKELRDGKIVEGYTKIIETLSARNKLCPNDILFYLTTQHSKKIMDTLIYKFELKRRIIDTCRNFGHVGCIDPLIGLNILIKEKFSLKPGDYLILLSAGNGYHWGGTLLQVSSLENGLNFPILS
jgi:3-oxoacyl-[acyl-carrier-protein] synthase-3